MENSVIIDLLQALQLKSLTDILLHQNIEGFDGLPIFTLFVIERNGSSKHYFANIIYYWHFFLFVGWDVLLNVHAALLHLVKYNVDYGLKKVQK